MANLIILKGRLAKDPEVKYTQATNVAITSLSIAVNRDYVKEGEERKADFFNCTAFGKTGEFISKYFKKGQEILVNGRLQNRSWETENGEKRYATDIIIDKIEFCGSKVSNSEEQLKDAGVDTNVKNDIEPVDELPF